MWQAPGLTIAAQAFLLVVLTDPDLPCVIRAAVLFAGLAAVVAATAALLRLRVRELQFSEAFARHSASIGVRDVRPGSLPPASPGKGLDGRARRFAARWLRQFYLIRIGALILFGIADVIAYFAA